MLGRRRGARGPGRLDGAAQTPEARSPPFAPHVLHLSQYRPIRRCNTSTRVGCVAPGLPWGGYGHIHAQPAELSAESHDELLRVGDWHAAVDEGSLEHDDEVVVTAGAGHDEILAALRVCGTKATTDLRVFLVRVLQIFCKTPEIPMISGDLAYYEQLRQKGVRGGS